MAAKSFAGCWFKNALDWSGLFDIGAAKDDQYGLLDIGAPSYDQCGPFNALNDNERAHNESVVASPEGLELTGPVCIDYLAPLPCSLLPRHSQTLTKPWALHLLF